MSDPPGGGLRPGANEGARRAVEGFFGDLLDQVALDAPVSRDRLVRALAALQVAVGARRDRLLEETDGERATVAGASVVSLSVDAWSDFAREGGLTPTDELAVRETHRRLVTAACDLRLPPRSDPLIVLPPS